MKILQPLGVADRTSGKSHVQVGLLAFESIHFTTVHSLNRHVRGTLADVR